MNNRCISVFMINWITISLVTIWVIFFSLILSGTAVAAELQLTQEERLWLDSHPNILVGLDAGYAPYSYLDDKSEFVGIAPDILDVF